MFNTNKLANYFRVRNSFFNCKNISRRLDNSEIGLKNLSLNASQKHDFVIIINKTNMPVINKRFMSEKMNLPGHKSKYNPIQYFKEISKDYSKTVYTGTTIATISGSIYLFGIKNLLIATGSLVSVPLLFAGRHYYIHSKTKSTLFKVLQKLMVDEYRQDIEKYIGPFDLQKQCIKIHSKEKIYDEQGRCLDAILGVINLSGAYGHATCKSMIVQGDKNWDIKLLELEHFNYLTNLSGVASIVSPKENVNLTIDSDSFETISETKKFFTHSLPENNYLNTPLIALTKISAVLMRYKEKKKEH